MSETNQENDMENILSSIKDILEEDEKNTHNTDFTENNEVDDIISDSDSTDIDDILELSPDMRVEDVSTSETQVDDVVFELDKITDEQQSDGPFFEMRTTEEETTDEGPFFEASNSELEIDDLLVDTTTDDNLSDIPANEPAVEEEITPLGDLVIEEPKVVEEITPLDDLVIEEPKVEEEIAPLDDLVIEEPAVEEEIAPLDDLVIEEPKVEEEIAPLDDLVIEEPAVVNSPELPQEDASTNIMNNFAKMFSHEEKVQETTISSVGNISKTLEEFVVDSIGKAIGNEISAKWNNGADFNAFAEAEIRRLVNAWISENMASLVEEAVKKEFERVMAKVGS